ncbi:MAG: hypothetical protein RI964_307 [Pseudomonadota bacterium]|jgi:hypothetical protein
MSQPHNRMAAVSLLPFGDRVALVDQEIQRRKQLTNPANPCAYVAAAWVRWIMRNVLDANHRGVSL